MLTACCCGQNLPDRRTPAHVKKSLRTQNPKSPQNADKKAVRKAAKQEAMKVRKKDPANQAADAETPKEENKQPEQKDKKDQKARAQQKTSPDSSTSPKPQVSVSQLYHSTWTSQGLTQCQANKQSTKLQLPVPITGKDTGKINADRDSVKGASSSKRHRKFPAGSLTSAKPSMLRPPKFRN